MTKVLVFGAARSGVAAALLLANKGYAVTITDKNEISETTQLQEKGISVYSGNHPQALKTDDWAFVVKNPGILYQNEFIEYFKEKGIPILNETEIALKYGDFIIGAITGTNGKTTTTTLLAELLKSEYPDSYSAGNIGYPLAALVNQGVNKAHIALEISAQQLIATPSLKPKVAVITNLSPDHLNYFPDLSTYYQSKFCIVDNMSEDDYFLLNLDDQTIVDNLPKCQASLITFSLKQKSDIYQADDGVYYLDNKLFSLSDWALPGEHNLQNAMVAAGMAFLLGVQPSNIQKVIRCFKGVEHRIEFVRTVNGVDYYNDSKATNVDSTIICLKALKGKSIILLAGGQDKKTGFVDLVPFLSDVKQLITYGETAEELKELKPGTIIVNNLKEAFVQAQALAEAGDLVVLSPACASLDQFINFEERGRLFKELVAGLD